MKILRFLFSAAHICIIVLLFGTLLNAYVEPKTFPWFNMLSLGFPVLMLLNIALIIFWIILWKKRAFVFLAASLLLWNPVKRWINFTSPSIEQSNLKIVSINIKGADYGREAIYDYLKNSDADLIFGQEYGEEFNVPGYEHRTDQYSIVAINSKVEIINHEKIETNGNGEAFFADVKVNGKTIRVINVYLNPFAFDKEKVKPSDDYDRNKRKLRYVAARLIPTFKIHQEEIDIIRQAIDDSPHPVILAGDLNAVPNSYEYYQIAETLTDAFMAVGNGNSTSFHDYKFPIRIDYVFASKEIIPVSYKVDRSQKLSDHYPVVAEFKID